MLRTLLLLACLLAAPIVQAAVPVWGARDPSPADTAPAALKPGEWTWLGGQATGPMAIIVSLDEQRAYVYRNGILDAVSTVSTGKPGHETPTGVFTILQKDKDHHSSKYHNAPMPYQERLTWDGIALHAGGLPGYPESHGCIHLPTAFAQRLFDTTSLGMTVVIAKQGASSTDLVHPTALSPIDTHTGDAFATLQLAPDEQFRWHPEASPEGPVAMVLSTADRRLVVLRNGVEIGRSRVEFSTPTPPAGTHAYLVAAGGTPGQMPPWLRVGIPGHADEAGTPVTQDDLARLQLPPGFVADVLPLLVPGTVLLQSDEHILATTTGTRLNVINADPPTL